MSEHPDVTEQAKDAVRLAILAAGDPLADDWADSVQRTIPKFAALTREDYGYWGNEAQGVIDAAVFQAKYVSHELEPSSQRLIVTIETKPSDNYPDGREPIRTERTDTPPGAAMLERISTLTPGDDIVLWKRMDKIAGGNRKVRVLVHFERGRPTKTQEPRVASPPRSEPARPPADEAPHPAPPRAPAAGGHSAAIAEQMDGLTNAQKIAVRKRCAAAGIANFMDPATTDDLDKVLVVIQETRKG